MKGLIAVNKREGCDSPSLVRRVRLELLISRYTGHFSGRTGKQSEPNKLNQSSIRNHFPGHTESSFHSYFYKQLWQKAVLNIALHLRNRDGHEPEKPSAQGSGGALCHLLSLTPSFATAMLRGGNTGLCEEGDAPPRHTSPPRDQQ